MDKKDLDENAVEAKIDAQAETIPQEAEQTNSRSPKTLDASNKEAPKTKTKPEIKAGSSGVSWGFLFNFVFLLLLTFTTCGGGYYLYQELTAQKEKASALSVELKQALNEPNRQISRLAKQQQELASSTHSGIDQIAANQVQLNERVAKLALRNPNHWMAEEAKYLVRMAGNKLWLEKDPSTAASLLKAADTRIESMKDPSLTPLRKALAKDISAVSAIKSTDITGTVLTLDSMIEHLHQLPLNRVELTNAVNRKEAPEMTESIDDWQANLGKFWQSIMDDFVVVRKRTTDITPILTPDQQWYLVENIRNKLLQSQLALYRQDQVNYRQSLTLARKWIYQYFDLNDPQTQAALSALEALKTLEIQTPTMEHFHSTALLQQLVVHGNLLASEDSSL
ncbi:uroporphyrinogen-III C-methyltransferase [Shewanella eurypsychrophilus]|uniref:Uroporphyrinogen-III C-methyltransferase n=1 Tax=Shewanella eurypsychrophilus TaxID=2593656 RepID=A0ABX6V4D5_9GAMM|nr:MULTISPECIES: uroporphyrinogen-III C-methyltransferase [Shewanella]QFU21121.1 uroporphyrinogen-III methylase [Shewanella sp. YLB-09]QPG56412.1 uroporphyrinogen-III C-methyltransferase [Shewanella eurypsychrophilus]